MSATDELGRIAGRLRELSAELADEGIADADAEARAAEAAELASRAGALLEEAAREIASGAREE